MKWVLAKLIERRNSAIWIPGGNDIKFVMCIVLVSLLEASFSVSL